MNGKNESFKCWGGWTEAIKDEASLEQQKYLLRSFHYYSYLRDFNNKSFCLACRMLILTVYLENKNE
jgi:hypothetical protein